MSSGLEINLNAGNFTQEVIESDVPVLVDFWAEWCGPCRMLAPAIDEIASEYSGKVKVCKLNVEEAPEVASTYGIMNIPTLLIFKSGAKVDRITGSVPKGDICAKLDQHLA